MQASPEQIIFFYILFVWVLFWKGIALWRAAHYRQRNWFIAMLVLWTYTFSILELIYLFRFCKKHLTLEEMKGWKNAFVKQYPEDRNHRDRHNN